MPRLAPIDPRDALQQARQALSRVNPFRSRQSNLVRTMARAPAALGAYIAMNQALDDGVLDPEVRLSIGLAVSRFNAAPYCLNAHARALRTLGVGELEISLRRDGHATRPDLNGILEFATSVAHQRGRVCDSEFDRLRSYGLGDAAILEIVGNVVSAIYGNYASLLAGVPCDPSNDVLAADCQAA